MVKEVAWTNRAILAYNRVIEYLLSEWSEKDAENFVNLTERIVSLVAKNPRAFRELEKRQHHEALITKHNLLVYEIKGNTVFILTVWDTRRNPRRKI